MRLKAVIVGAVVFAAIGAVLCGIVGALVSLSTGMPIVLGSIASGALVGAVLGSLAGAIRGSDLLYTIDAHAWTAVFMTGCIIGGILQDISPRVWIALVALLAVAGSIAFGVWFF